MSTGHYAPAPADRFSFGIWTVGWQGVDVFGGATRPPMPAERAVYELAELGAYGVNFHDNDVFEFGAGEAERDERIAAFRKALDETGLVVTTATTNLFGHPVFKDGGFTANDRDVRRFALAKVMRNIDLAAELGARIYVCWGGRDGAESGAAKDIRAALDRCKEAFDVLCEYVLNSGYNLRFAIEPKPNEPRGDIFLPTVGHALHFITTLEHPEMVGVNPEVAHETMAGLSFVHGVSQALWAGKLFHIDLNSQRIGRYDQDYRFGAEDLKEAFLLVNLLETSGYEGVRHFDAHAYRSEDSEGVWEFASGCMRTYLALAAKSRQLEASEAIRAARNAARVDELAEPSVGPYSREAASALLGEDQDLDALAGHGYANERLDQLVVELLLGSG